MEQEDTRMTEREKLVNLLKVPIFPHEQAEPAEVVADYLLANGVTVQKWIPVEKELPEEMCQCVCRYVFGENADHPFFQVLWYFANSENPHFQHEGSMGMKVTHWMPLSEPPKEEV